MKADYQKALKKSTLFFLLNPVPFNEQSCEKQKEPETSDQSLFRLHTKQVQENSFISYILPDKVWVIAKITSENLWKPAHDIVNYSTFICPFVSGKCGKEGKKVQKFEYLENKKSFLDETRNNEHN